ncbi:MAG: DUF2855 family protein [Pseudomonadota bacterium]
MTKQFEVEKSNFQTFQVQEAQGRSLAEGEVRVKIDFFAFTANNLTYAVAGDMLGYWQFFPASAETQGIIPVWGFADVVESNSAEVDVGERIYGYLPPATELILMPTNAKADSWFDASAHRQSLPPLYNRYQRLPAQAEAERPREVSQALLGPLYMTGYLLYDYLKVNEYFGAEQVLILSASSKTSIGLAYALAQDETPPVVGLTSTGNQGFVEGLGYYQDTVAYDALDSLAIKPTVIVDMAGNAELVAKLKAKLGDELKYFVSVGLTHWDQQQADLAGGGENETFFFAPSYMLERSAEDKELPSRVQGFVGQGAAASLDWLELKQLDGLEGLATIYSDMCTGQVSPKLGVICQM